MSTHPCGDPILSEDVHRHEDNCLRCLSLTNQHWTLEDEAAAEAAHHPKISHPRKEEP